MCRHTQLAGHQSQGGGHQLTQDSPWAGRPKPQLLHRQHRTSEESLVQDSRLVAPSPPRVRKTQTCPEKQKVSRACRHRCSWLCTQMGQWPLASQGWCQRVVKVLVTLGAGRRGGPQLAVSEIDSGRASRIDQRGVK